MKQDTSKKLKRKDAKRNDEKTLEAKRPGYLAMARDVLWSRSLLLRETVSKQ